MYMYPGGGASAAGPLGRWAAGPLGRWAILLLCLSRDHGEVLRSQMITCYMYSLDAKKPLRKS